MDRQKNGKQEHQHPSPIMQQQQQQHGTTISPSFGRGPPQHHQQQSSPTMLQGNSGIGGMQYLGNASFFHSSPPPGFAQQGNLPPPGYQPLHNNNFQQQGNTQQSYYNPTTTGFSQQQQQMPNFNQNYGGNEFGSQFQNVQFHSRISPNSTVHEQFYNNNVSHNEAAIKNKHMENSRTTNLNSPTTTTTFSGVQSENKSHNNNGGVIKPLIDNIVGSMMCNGTYTPFGPLGGISMIPSDFTKSTETSSLPDFGIGTATSSPFMTSISAQSENNLISNDKQRKGSPIHDSFPDAQTGRASTPSDGTEHNTSRPHTPNKPSYSEILAKSANAAASKSSISQPANSTTAPATTSTSNSQQSQASNKETLAARKFDVASVSSASSATSSSCTSSSSSPIVKQKTLSQTIMGRLFTTSSYGKENNIVGSGGNITKNYSRPVSTSTNTTPTHQRKSIPEIKPEDRKILSSQNAANNKHKQLKVSSNKNQQESTTDDANGERKSYDENEEKGWTTYSRNKNANRNSIPSMSNTPVNNKTVQQDEDDEVMINSTSSIAEGVIDENNTSSMTKDNNSEDQDSPSVSRRESLTEKRSYQSPGGISTSSATTFSTRDKKGKEKEKPPKAKRENRQGRIRRCEKIAYLWGATMISALAWLVKLVTDVFTLSVTVGSTLVEDLYSWWLNKAVPSCLQQFHVVEEMIRVNWRKMKQKLSLWTKWLFRKKAEEENSEFKKNSQDLLAALGPDKNIQLTNADETLKRLLSCKGQDPYTILGVRSDSSDETIRRYYKKQAVLVHPDKNLVIAAEEAFKILGRAFELVGEPSKRQEYHNTLLEAHAKEQVYGEIGKLIEQLRKKMEIATSSIRCTKCNLRHKKNKTDRPLFAARYCAQCNVHHAAKEGELWAESKGWFGLSWNYFTCMDCHIWEINEWAKCQKKNLLHIKADSHCVMYRLVAGGGNGGQQSSGNSGTSADGQFHVNSEDDWDSLINNLYKSGGVPGSKGGDHFYQQGNGSANNYYSGANGASTNTGSGAGKKRKGKRK